MYVSVRVTPSAKREKLEKKQETIFNIAVKEEARHNRANMRVRELVAEHFRIAVERVKIISGHRSPKKIISIDTDY
jgi:uncharacterized protein YggU (UPF0235/DUF167 family)